MMYAEQMKALCLSYAPKTDGGSGNNEPQLQAVTGHQLFRTSCGNLNGTVEAYSGPHMVI